MSRAVSLICTSIVAIAAAILPMTVRSQWASDSTTNTPVCTASNAQQYPKICSDGSDGAIIVWEDMRSGIYRVYAQRLDATGKAVWAKNGIPVASTTTNQRYPIVASDNNGGAYVVWQDWRNIGHGIDLYAQHITSSGTLAFDTTGKPVADTTGDQTNASIVADGAGNAFVVWEDNRAANSSLVPDIYANKITPTTVAWTPLGIAVSTQTNAQRRPMICDDGTGGCYIAWSNDATVPTSVYAQHLDASGNLKWTTPYGLAVFQGDYGTKNSRNISIRRDGNQVMLAWEMTDINSVDGQDIYANRLTSTGSKIYYSPVSVTGSTGEWLGDQTFPMVFSDDSVGTGQFPYAGMMTVFMDNSVAPQGISMQRTLGDGNSRLPSNSLYKVSTPSVGLNGFDAVRVGNGTLLVAWNDARNDTCIYAQCFDRTLKHYFPSNAPSGWALPVSVHAASKASQVALAPRTNGGIATWTDYRSGNADIYAQLIFKDGSLPVELVSFNLTAPRVGEIDLSWQTTNELNCAGFEIQRREIAEGLDNSYTVVASYETDGSLRGAGSSGSAHYYAYRDRTVDPAKYEYRLVDISYDGTRHATEPKLIDAAQITYAGLWSLGQNEPNPFMTTMDRPITLGTYAIVDLTIYDVTGRVVAMPVGHMYMTSGMNTISIDARAMGTQPNGSYMVRMTATDPEAGTLLWQSLHPLMISLIR